MAEESKIVGVLSSIEDAIRTASGALDTLNEKALKGGLGFDVIIKSVETSTKLFDGLIDSVGALGSALTLGLDFGLISGGFSKLGSVFKMVMGVGTELAGIFDGVGVAIDSVSGFSRELNSTLFDSVSKFNGSFESAKKFSDFIMKSSQDFATAEMGFISPKDRLEAVKGLEQAGIPLERMTDTINSTAGSMDVLNVSFLQSKSLGLEMASYIEMLGDAMQNQGLTSQQAAEQLALFGDVSGETGLRVDKIGRSLQNLSKNFSKLGLTASFGKPILEGFSSSLSGMGLGIENAIELSETLSGALAKLTSDYSTAFITFQRGGLDMGGGQGALGASIGLRAKMLEANENGGDQSEIAGQLAGALKETISSFTGGQIINVKQAAENPALQQTFFTQTQLLKDLYGITDAADQDRTLELLQQIGSATEQGDKDLAASLGKDLMESINVQDKTLGYQEKTSKFSEATYASLQFLNKNVVEGFRLSGDSLAQVFSDFQKAGVDSPMVQDLIKDLNSKSPEDMKVDFAPLADKLQQSMGNGLSLVAEGLGNLDYLGQSIADALSGTVLNVSNSGADAAMNILAGAINDLVIQLGGESSKRANSKLFGG